MKKPSTYKVGYGKPPASAQFKKGESGNPSGKKKPKSLVQVLQDQLDDEVTVKGPGKVEKRPVKDVLIARLIKRALDGDIQSMRLIIQNASRSDPANDKPASLLTDHEIQQLKDLLDGS